MHFVAHRERKKKNGRIAPLLLALPICSLACAPTKPLRTDTLDGEVGPSPTLPEPRIASFPTLHIAPARGWAEGEKPVAAPGFAVERYAAGLDHPRSLHVLPNGDVLVAETNAPPGEAKGLRAWMMRRVKTQAGGGAPSANRIRLLRDADGDGVAELSTVFADGLHSPFGIELVGETLYVANTDAVVRFAYREGDTRVRDAAFVAPLPAGPINRHWTRDLVAAPGVAPRALLYVSVGSNSNVAERGLAEEKGRALILELDPDTGQLREYATGLRNANGLAWHPATGALWTVVNERDELGDDLVPDYLTAVEEGAFYGWPYSYYGRHIDPRVEPQAPELVARTVVPDYALGSHTAPLGLAFYQGELFPARYAEGAFIGLHGSWNRERLSGYKVIFVPFRDGEPAGPPEDVLTGFVDARGDARGRPVGVAIDRRGALLVADDVGNCVWRVTPAPVGRFEVRSSRPRAAADRRPRRALPGRAPARGPCRRARRRRPGSRAATRSWGSRSGTPRSPASPPG
jgi:glucose/arabinose dehydrogenase